MKASILRHRPHTPISHRKKRALKAFGIFTILTAVCVWIPTNCNHPQPTIEAEQLPAIPNETTDPARIPKQPSDISQSVSISQLLCSYQGAHGALGRVQRTRKQAMRRAKHLLTIARFRNTDFGNLAQRYSDDPASASKGGFLGIFVRGELHPDLETAAFSMNIGQISEIVETPKGFHILQRRDMQQAQAREILISYKGAKKYTPRRKRTHQDAKLLSMQIHKRLQAGSDFEQEAVAYSDLPNYQSGGIHKSFIKNSRHPVFEKIVWNLQVGEISDITETITGFHIIKRLPLEKIQVRRILIRFQSNPQESPWSFDAPIRIKTEAYEKALSIHKMTQPANSDFASLAALHSDGPERKNSGLMEPFERGQIDYLLERTAFMLQVGQISDIVEGGDGYFIIKRVL